MLDDVLDFLSDVAPQMLHGPSPIHMREHRVGRESDGGDRVGNGGRVEKG